MKKAETRPSSPTDELLPTAAGTQTFGSSFEKAITILDIVLDSATGSTTLETLDNTIKNAETHPSSPADELLPIAAEGQILGYSLEKVQDHSKKDRKNKRKVRKAFGNVKIADSKVNEDVIKDDGERIEISRDTPLLGIVGTSQGTSVK